MKTCAITMVYQDHWALSKWYAHYARHIGAENLYIVAHGADPKIAEICKDANIITIPRDTLAGFDRVRGHMLNSLQDSLGVAYDWVIRTDADELIFSISTHHDFQALFASFGEETALYSIGLNITPDRRAVFSGHYSKAWAVKRGTHLVRHGAKVTDEHLTLPKGVYLAHLKFADEIALNTANKHRTHIAGGEEQGLPGRAWREADRVAKRFYNKVNDMSEIDWAEAADDAYEQIKADPIREGMILRAKSIDFDVCTHLPDWFDY